MKDEDKVKPRFVSVKVAAAYTNESEWTIKNALREGTLKARKSGRRTLVEFSTVERRAESMPAARFAPSPRSRRAAS